MEKIKAFISYSSQQKKLAGRLKIFLQFYCGYNVFLAHDDIPGGMEWEKEIYIGIEQSDLFVPLLSSAFRLSEFADQEIGIAVTLKKKIIPIKLESVNPYGFIQKYQALQYKTFIPTSYQDESDNMKELGLTIGNIGLSYKENSTIYKKARISIIDAFFRSGSFSTTNAIIQLLLNCNDYSREDLQKLKTAIRTNNQISGAFGLSMLIKFLQSTFNFSVD